jgi:YebC/PmpR family DNA-binding regulatory protein
MGRKSAKIAARKGAQDKLKSQVYTKALFEVTRAVKRGGEDPDTNFLLRVALNKCRKNNVPKDNIQRAIKKGLGSEGDNFSDVMYEGYGPGGVAVFVETSTDNVTRTVANMRFYFSRNGGTLGQTGSLQFLFDHKSVFEVLQSQLAEQGLDEDDFMLEMIDAGAEEVEPDEDSFIITGAKEDFGSIQAKLEELSITPEEAGLERIPNNRKEIDDDTFEQVMKLIDVIEGDDDVVQVFHNMDVD